MTSIPDRIKALKDSDPFMAEIWEYVEGFQWISVEDRLPVASIQVLTFPYGPLAIRHIKESGEWFFDAIPVTHWMPLPKPRE